MLKFTISELLSIKRTLLSSTLPKLISSLVLVMIFYSIKLSATLFISLFLILCAYILFFTLSSIDRSTDCGRFYHERFVFLYWFYPFTWCGPLLHSIRPLLFLMWKPGSLRLTVFRDGITAFIVEPRYAISIYTILMLLCSFLQRIIYFHLFLTKCALHYYK